MPRSTRRSTSIAWREPAAREHRMPIRLATGRVDSPLALATVATIWRVTTRDPPRELEDTLMCASTVPADAMYARTRSRCASYGSQLRVSRASQSLDMTAQLEARAGSTSSRPSQSSVRRNARSGCAFARPFARRETRDARAREHRSARGLGSRGVVATPRGDIQDRETRDASKIERRATTSLIADMSRGASKSPK